MDPATISLILGAFQLAIKLAPDAIEAAIEIRKYIAGLVSGGVITADVQNQLYAEMNTWMKVALTGQVPEHWKVKP